MFYSYILNVLSTSAIISSINFLAFSYFSGGPSMNTFLTSVFGISFLAIWILQPVSLCNLLIVSPFLPMIKPTQSFGTGKILAY